MDAKHSVASFMKAIFLGDFHESVAFPYPRQDAETTGDIRLILEAVREFGDQHVDPVTIDSEGTVPDTTIQAMAEMGLFGLTIPKEYGGYGLDQTSYARVTQELVRQDSSTAIVAMAHQSIGIKALLLFGNDEQKQRFLPDLATGKSLAGFALTEPGAGSDAYAITTTAELSQDGRGYTLNGQKIWITNGGIGDFFTVFAKTKEGDRERITAFAVTRDMQGFSSGPEEKKMGIRGSSTTTLTFDNVKVPAANVIGEPGKGFKIAMTVLNSGRLGLGGGCVGGLRNIIELATKHATQRKQFNRPIAEYGQVQEKLGRMALDTYALESMVFLTTGMVDAGLRDYAIESAICKVFGSEALERGAREALQIAGGAGFMQEYPYERIVRDARIMPIFEGTNEILRCFIALNGMQGVGEYLKVIGNALTDPIKSLGLLSELVAKRITKSLTSNTITGAHPQLKREAALIEDNVKRLNAAAEKVLRKYRKAIWEKQFIQKRIANIAIDLYGMIATVSRASSEVTDTSNEQATAHLNLCKNFCEDASRRIQSNLSNMDENIDDGLQEAAAMVCEHHGYKLDIL